MKKFICLTTLVILTRYADAQTTYLHTSDLKKEANPLVSILGFGWTELILSQVIVLSIAIYALWVYCFRSVSVPQIDKRISLKGFISLFYFNDPNSFFKVFYKLPTNKNSLPYSAGYVITYSLIFMSALISLSTTLLLTSKAYRTIYSTYNIPVWLYFLCVLVVIFFSIKFFKKELQLRAVS